MERWIKGADLLTRWNAKPFELLKIMRNGFLTPKDEWRGTSRTPENAPCLYCTRQPEIRNEHSIPCPHGKMNNCIPNVDETNCHGQWESPEHWEPSNKRERLHYAAFFLLEVEVYEQTHGLGPLAHKPESAEALAETLRAAGITDAGMIARMIMSAYPMNERALGALMRGEKDDDGNKSANIKTARRLLDKE